MDPAEKKLSRHSLDWKPVVQNRCSIEYVCYLLLTLFVNSSRYVGMTQCRCTGTMPGALCNAEVKRTVSTVC